MTLWQPWAWAMCHGKEVENRTWWPPSKVLGKLVAIHAATRPQPAKVERGELDRLAKIRIGALPRFPMPMREELVRGAFVAVGRLMGAVEHRDTSNSVSTNPSVNLTGNAIVMANDSVIVAKVEEIARASRYAERGCVNWVFRPIAVLDEPVPYWRGLQRVWTVPPEVEERIVRQVDPSVFRTSLKR